MKTETTDITPEMVAARVEAIVNEAELEFEADGQSGSFDKQMPYIIREAVWRLAATELALEAATATLRDVEERLALLERRAATSPTTKGVY